LLWLTGILPFFIIGLAELLGWFYPRPSLYLGGLVAATLGAGYLFWFTAVARQKQAIGTAIGPRHPGSPGVAPPSSDGLVPDPAASKPEAHQTTEPIRPLESGPATGRS